MWVGQIAALFLLVWHAYRLLTAFLNAFYPAHPVETSSKELPKVSLLLPVRNERSNLPAWFGMLQHLRPLLHEVLVYDDQSTDGSAEWIKKHGCQPLQVELMRGETLPAGWYGKHHACHQLSLRASGDYWLFVDADVRFDAAFLQRMVRLAETEKLHLLSVFPKQQHGSWGEALWGGMLSHSLLSGLWLPLVRRLPWWQVAAANGQFMLFEATSYRQNEWHARVRQQLTEDLAIARALKKEGHAMAVLQALSGLYCRMYGSGKAALAGLTRNVVPAMGNWRWALGWALLMAAAWVGTWLAWPQVLPFVGAMLLLTRIFVLQASAESVPQQMGLWPVQLFAWPYLWCYGIYAHLTRRIRWKDRPVN